MDILLPIRVSPESVSDSITMLQFVVGFKDFQGLSVNETLLGFFCSLTMGPHPCQIPNIEVNEMWQWRYQYPRSRFWEGDEDVSAYDTDEELAKHVDFSVIDLLTQDVSAYDSDEELAKHVDISIFDLFKLTQINTRRWKQLARWHAGANYYIRQALANSRRHWAHMACKMMSERNDRCKELFG